MQVRVFWIGKTRLPGVAALTEEYGRRLAHYCDFQGEEIRKGGKKTPGVSPAEAAIMARSAGFYRVALDSVGQKWDSQSLSAFLRKLREETARPVCFCVGEADGFSPQFRQQADRLLSLSPMTLPHELARVVLLEQLYRAFALLAHHPYPR